MYYVDKAVDEEYLNLASIIDIGCMKLSAITGRATSKDYIDLYFILKSISLPDLLDKAHQKYSELDRNLILKSLVYFEDVTQEKINFKNNHEVTFEQVKELLMSEVKKLAGNPR